MASFADVDLTPLLDGWMGGSEKVQNHADVIYGWSQMKQERKKFKKSRAQKGAVYNPQKK